MDTGPMGGVPASGAMAASGTAVVSEPGVVATEDSRREERSARRRPPRRSLYSSWVDFLMLGGGSWVVMGTMAAFYPSDAEARAALATVMLFVAHFVNNPHFAHSYQIFYRGFARKVSSGRAALRARYRFAGVMVPATLLAFFATAVVNGSAALLGLAANVMFFTVGWHYAKQGFGIFMLDASHSGTTFGGKERRNLLLNTHLTWVTYWLWTNDAVARKSYWGLSYYTFDTPDLVLHAMATLAAMSLCVVARDLFRTWRQGVNLPLNGLVGYVSSVYVWLMFGWFEPVVLLLAPAFHSLQYLAVVWYRELNVERERADKSLSRGAARWWQAIPVRLARFMIVGGLLGASGFWWVPELLDAHVAYERAVFGATVFLFMSWTFINIHHYFMDAVIWRRENEETRLYLFGADAGRTFGGSR